MAFFTLTVTGKNFSSTATARIGGVPCSVNYINRNKIEIGVDTSTLPLVAKAPLVIYSDGQYSNAFDLILSTTPPPPVLNPTLTSCSPSPIRKNNGTTTLTFAGTNFAGGATKLLIDGAEVTPTVVSSTSMTFALDTAVFSSSTSIAFKAKNGVGHESSVLNVPIRPLPVLSSCSPDPIVTGSGTITVTLTGTDFLSGITTLKIDGNAVTATVVDSTHLSVSVNTNGDVATTIVFQASNGTGLNSNTLTIDVEAPPLPPYLLVPFANTGYNVSDNTATARSAFDIAPTLGDCTGQTTSLSQDGAYLAFLAASGDAVWAYKRNGDSWSKMTVVDVPQAVEFAGGISISPDGNCLVIAYDWNYNSGTPIYIWNRNGLTWENRTVLAANCRDIGVATTLVWSSDSQYLAGCEWVNGTLTPRVWKNVAGTLTPLTIPATSGWVTGLAWHPSSNYLIAVLSGGVNPVLYSRSGDTFTITGSIADYTGGNKAVTWSADGTTLFLGGTPGYSNPFSGVKPYAFNGSTFVPLPTNYSINIGYNLYMLPGSSTELWDGSPNNSNRLSFASGTLENLGDIAGGVPSYVRSWALADPTPVAPFANISSFSPTTLTAGSGIVTLTVNGQNFTAGATALVGEDITPLTFVSASQVTLDVDTDLLTAGTVGISIITTNGTATKDITAPVGEVYQYWRMANVNAYNTATYIEFTEVQFFDNLGARVNTSGISVTSLPANSNVGLLVDGLLDQSNRPYWYPGVVDWIDFDFPCLVNISGLKYANSQISSQRGINSFDFQYSLDGITYVTVASFSNLVNPGGTTLSSLLNVAPQETDPYFSSVSLLLHMDGSNGSTTFTDASNNALTVTANGNAQISTAQSKFGGASGYFDGTGDYLQLQYSSLFNLSASINWTIELWFNSASFSAVSALISKDTYGSSFDWAIIIDNSTTLKCFTQSTSSTLAVTVPAMSTGTWYHVALVNIGNTSTFYLNGVGYGSQNMYITNDSQSYLTIGCIGWNNPGYLFNGYIDDLRVTKGVARYTASFTPPTAPFPAS